MMETVNELSDNIKSVCELFLEEDNDYKAYLEKINKQEQEYDGESIFQPRG